jgi:mannose-6-phosphate isomerase-like protein (cupin superfamily)
VSVPIVLRPGEGQGADLGSVRFKLKASGEDTNGAYSLVEASGNVFATAHVHHDREEAFFVLEGRVTFLAGEDRVEAEPGSFLLVPRETMHGFKSQGDARLIIIHSPGGFERFFRETSEAIKAGTWDVAFRDRLASELGMTYHDEIEV